MISSPFWPSPFSFSFTLPAIAGRRISPSQETMEAKRNVEECILHGPWGSRNGEEWIYLPKGFINKITVRHGSFVGSIKFQTYCSKCSVGDLPSWSHGFYRKDTIHIDYPNEYLVSISGTFATDYVDDNLTSICFKTNKNSYGPFGTERGKDFSYDCKDGVIVGFHGLSRIGYGKICHKYLTAIGVHVMPKSLAFVEGSSTFKDKTMHQLCSSMPGMVMPREPGPWGAIGGKPWDDGVFCTIKQVVVHLGKLNVIYALQFEYLKRDGKSVMSYTHGGTDGTEIELVKLDAKDDEYLIGISGYYGPVEGYEGLEAIVSITFHTNKRMYGPYGKERGAGYVHYSSTASPGRVVGFQGRNNGFLGAVGVHMEYF